MNRLLHPVASGVTAGIALSFVIARVIDPSFANPVTVAVPPMTLQVPGYTCTAAGQTLTCTPSGGTVPTGCVSTINGSSSTSFTSAGGTALLNVSGCTPPSNYAWTKNGSPISTAASFSDTLPANASGSPVVSTYQVQACAGGCATLPALTATVAASGGGSCAGFANTINLTANWNNPQRLFADMGPNDVVVVRVTVGGVSSPNNNLPRIAAAEYQSGPSTREATFAASACDFSPQPWPGGQTSGTSVTIPFAVGSGANFGYYPIVPLNGTYYFNIKNAPASSCSVMTCRIAIDLTHP